MCVVCLAACWAPAAIAAAPNDMFVYKWLIWVSDDLKSRSEFSLSES